MSDDRMGGYSNEVQQAVGMVSVQADCLLEEALVMMDARAQVSRVTIYEIAQQVLERRIRFGPPSTH